MIRLPQPLADQILEHATADAPKECVGVVVCHVSTGECRVVQLKNVADEPEHNYEVAEKEILRLYRAMHKAAEYIAAVYHSHLAVEAVPSKNDHQHADIEDAVYLIAAPQSRGRKLRAWDLSKDTPTELHLVLSEG